MKAIHSYISHHLLPVITIFFIAGIWLVPSLSPVLFSDNSPVFAGLTFLGLCIFSYTLAKTSFSTIPLCICALVVGYVHGFTHMQPPKSQQHIYNQIQAKTEVVLTGYLSEMVTYDGKMSRAVIDIDTVRKKEDNRHTSAHGKVLLSFRGEWPTSILPGDYVAIRATVKRPHSYYSIGTFDYERFLAQKDIWITGFIKSPLFIKELTNNLSSSPHPFYRVEQFRSHVGLYLDTSLPKKFSSFYRALLLGDRRGVSSENMELFKATGTFHILAISGLHIAVIATFLYLLLYWLFSRSERLLLHLNVRKLVAVVTLPLLLCYALLAGMNSPVTRAVVMSSIVILALCTDRVKSPAPLVAAAALIILIFDPLQLFTVSFQLSFAATIGILFIFPYLQQLLKIHPHEKQYSFLHKGLLYLHSAFLVSLAATLATAPIAVSSFNRMSTIGPLANLIMEPLICLWCLPCGIVALPFMYLSPPVADVMLHFGTYGILSALKVADVFTLIPMASIHLASPPPLFIFLYAYIFIGCATGTLWKSKKTVYLFMLPVIILTTFIFVGRLPSKTTHPIISFLDVGQGSATVIQDGTNTILIDGGGSSFSSRSVGESIIAPFLWNRGITHVDTIIITHPDADHYNGLPYITQNFSPNTIWVRDFNGHDSAYKEYIKTSQMADVRVKIAKPGDTLYKGNILLECKANLGAHTYTTSKSSRSNNAGLIIKGCTGKTCFLFPGDISTSMEHSLLSQNIDLSADFFLAAHHGSITSNSQEFLEQIQPGYTIVSAGSSNSGHFPHHSFLEKCEKLGIKVLNTSINGSIDVTLTNRDPEVHITRKYRNNPLYPFRDEKIVYRPSSTEIE